MQPPIRTDGSNPFARYSMEVRVPKILDEVVLRNPDFPASMRDAVHRLRDDIRADALLPPLGFPAPDDAEWADGLARRGDGATSKGDSWLGADWFFAECYVYRCLMDRVRYWETARDPFAPAKAEEISGERPWKVIEAVEALGDASDEDRLHALLGLALWGNRVDLSYAVGVAFGGAGEADDLLVDDRSWAVPRLLSRGGDVHLVADNTGSELLVDFVLAETLLTLAEARITLHVKMHPTFVSDAIAADVWFLLAAMRKRGGTAGAIASRIRAAFDQGRLRVVPDFFWNGPKFLWERPARLGQVLDRATFVLLKGDANYRRLIGDAMWAPDASFPEVTSYFPPPILCLRTLKSDAILGLSPGMAEKLDAVDREWRINGRRGVIQGSGNR
jgi:hypothetical protein